MLALLALSALLASSVQARERPYVQVRLPAELPAEASQRLLSALGAQLADLVFVEVAASGSARPLCMLWISSTPAGLSIQFAAAQGEPLSAPRVIAGAPGELVASEIASISRAFVLARLEQSEVSAPSSPARTPEPAAAEPSAESPARSTAPDAAPAPDTARERPAEDPARTAAGSVVAELSAPRATVDRHVFRETAPGRLRVAAFYTGTSYARELPWQNGLRAEASARISALIYLGLSYAYYAPADVATAAVRLRVSAHTLSALFGLGRTWRVFGVGLDAALGCLERLRSTKAVSRELTPDGDSKHWSLLAGLRLHGRVRFPNVPWLALDLAPALELNPGARRMAVTESAGKSHVLSPHFVRARVDLGASFDLF